MKRKLNKILFLLILLFTQIFPCFASDSEVNTTPENERVKALSEASLDRTYSSNAVLAFVEGCQAYSKGEWENAVFSLRKAIAYGENEDPDAYYMLISAEMYNSDYKSALNDCNSFLERFPDSIYNSRIHYFKGRILYSLKDYEMAIIVLSDYCHQYQNDEMYPYALYYIAESLYSAYKYEESAALYERIVSEYPDSDRVGPSQYRLESIAQRTREEKLLYLLKQTGEAYLSAKEDYEKQLRLYNAESISSTRQKLSEAQQKNEELENQIKALEKEIADLRTEVAAAEEARQAQENQQQKIEQEATVLTGEESSEVKDELRLLTLKVLEVQRRMEEKLDTSIAQ